jgi:hypothetical protein
MGEFLDKFHEHNDAVFRVAVCRIFDLPSSRVLSTLRSPSACVCCHLLVQAIRGDFESASVDMLDNAWTIAFADHLARCSGNTFVHTAKSWLVTALADIISEVCGALGVSFEVLTDPAMLGQLPYGNDGLLADDYGCFARPR